MDLNNMQAWQYFAFAGGGVLVLGIIVYFLPAGKLKIPAVITTAFGGLAAGVAVGVLFMAMYGYKPNRPEDPPTEGPSQTGPAAPPGGGMGGGMGGDIAGMPKGGGGMPKGGGGMPKGGGGMPKGGGGMPKGGGGMAAPPSARVQLATLVIALDKLADQPLTIALTPESRGIIVDQLKGLDSAAEIKEDDAKSRVDTIHQVLEKHRKTLEAVGYRWALDAKGALPPPPQEGPNPVKDGLSGERLKSLQERLAGKK